MPASMISENFWIWSGRETLSELVVIGSASATPMIDRFCTAYALVDGGNTYLLDCGAPVSTLLYRAGLDPRTIRAVFLSHWHIDHVAGLPLLLSQLGLLRHPRPLWVYGPPGTQSKLDAILAAGFLSRGRLSYKCHTTDATCETWYHVPPISACFYPTTHLDDAKYSWLRDAYDPSWVAAYGIVIRIGNSKLVYGGDCGAPEDATQYIEGCDLLIHEMGHHQPEDIAIFAERCRVPRLLIGHIHPDWNNRSEEVLKIVSSCYGGEIMVARDGMRIPL